MDEISQAEFEVATEQGRIEIETEAHATAARYDAGSDRIIVDLMNGCTFTFPPKLAEGLQDASPAQLAVIDLSPSGSSLHWPALDIDFGVAGLVAGIFGTRAYLARLAEQSGPVAGRGSSRPHDKDGQPRRTASA